MSENDGLRRWGTVDPGPFSFRRRGGLHRVGWREGPDGIRFPLFGVRRLHDGFHPGAPAMSEEEWVAASRAFHESRHQR